MIVSIGLSYNALTNILQKHILLPVATCPHNNYEVVQQMDQELFDTSPKFNNSFFIVKIT